jgi:hypothetical protein
MLLHLHHLCCTFLYELSLWKAACVCLQVLVIIAQDQLVHIDLGDARVDAFSG